MDCIFCKIVDKKIPSPRVYEDDHTIVIRDLHPQAKEHFLVIPKVHVTSLIETWNDPAEGRKIIGNLFYAADQVVKQEGLLPDGYRSVINTGAEGGQSVFHLHLHILGGQKMKDEFA